MPDTNQSFGSNWIDRAIGYLSPQAGLRRAYARSAYQLLQDQARRREEFSYEGARTGRRTSGWVSGGTSANVEVLGGLTSLRNRSRELCRNNRYARKAVKELAGAIVGTGIEIQAKTGNESLDKRIQTEWNAWCRHCDASGRLDFYGLQRQSVRAIVESGEIFVRFKPRLISSGLRIPLQLQTLEGDYVDHTNSQVLADGGFIEMGVECDKDRKPRAYHMYEQHPGGAILGLQSSYYKTVRVPARDIVHAYDMERPEQYRGVPWLATVMLPLRDLDDYDEAERFRKKAEACVVAFVTRGIGDDGASPALGQQTNESGSVPNRVLERMQPGMIARLDPGQEVAFNSPQPSSGGRDYKTGELQGIAAGCDVTYERMTADYANVTFSSWRGGDNSFKNNVQAFQWLMLVPMLLQPIWERFIDTLILLDVIPDGTSTNCEYHMPPLPSIDPLKDAEAEEMEIRAGTKTFKQAIIGRGRDPEEHCREIAESNALLDKYGVISDADPRHTPKKASAGAPAGASESTPAPSVKPAGGKPNGKAAASPSP